MNIYIRIATLIAASIVLAIPTLVFGEDAAKNPPLTTLGKIDAEALKDISHVNIRVQESSPSWKSYKMSDHGSFIQIDLDHTIVPKPGEFLSGQGPYISKLAAFQISETKAAVRIFLSEDAATLKKAMKIENLGTRLMVSFDHTKAADLIANDPKNTAVADGDKTAEEIIKSTTVDTSIKSPASVMTPTPGQAFNFQEKLSTVAIFCGLLILMGLLSFYVSPRFRASKNLKKRAANSAPLKSIASYTVGQKQKIELIEAEGQKFLIAVTPGQVNFLTAVETPAAKVQVQRQAIAMPESSRQAHPQTTTARPTQKPIPKAYKEAPKATEAVSDVTRMIREKLRNLPSV